MIRILRRLLELPSRRRRLLARTALLLVAVRLSLPLVSFSRLRRLLARVRREGRTVPGPAGAEIERIVWSIGSLAAYLPWLENCLVQALVGEALMAEAGVSARLCIGVAPGQEMGLQAHAWLESEGRVVLGHSEPGRFTPFPSLGRGIR